MGVELDSEGAETPMPSNYMIMSEITVPDSDNSSTGHFLLKLYRPRTILLPGESI